VDCCNTTFNTEEKRTAIIGWRKRRIGCSNLSCRQKESSSSEEKGENAKLAVPEKIGTPKLVEDKIPEAELILFLDAGLDDSQLKALSHRKRAAESVSKLSEEKKPPCRARRTNPKCDVQVIVEENSVTMRQLTTHNFYSIVDQRGIIGEFFDKT
jgi:hypothetical protein